MDNTNGQKRIIKKRRLNIKRVFILTLVLFIISVAIYYAFELEVTSVTVSGANYVNDSEIIKSSKILKRKFLMVTSHSACKNIKQNDFINTCKIKKSWWLKINIIVTENKPLFIYTQTDKAMLSNGKETSKKNISGIPTLINYVPKDVLSKFVLGLKDINNDIIQSISEIEYAPSLNEDGSLIDEERFMMTMNDGNIVYINNRNIKVLNKYEKIYASIGNKKGYFNFDADYDNYYFQEFGEEE